jgi:hypothetical protein
MKFSIENIKVGRRRGRGNDALDISMSVRSGECLDGPIPLMYTDPMLAGESRFMVNGLTLEELGAEKVLGWTTKEQSRHYIDLAYMARDFELDHDKAADLICKKFDRESRSARYRQMRTVSALAREFSAADRIGRIRRSWAEDLGTQILFLPEEQDRPKGSLIDFDNVEGYVNQVWVPILTRAVRAASGTR